MIKYLKHSEIDFLKWDNCINSAHNELIYANSWYLNIVSPKWDALILDDYLAVMPITWKRKYGIKYAFPPLFTQQLGIFSKNQLSSLQVESFLHCLSNEFRFIDIFLNSKNFTESSIFSLIPKPNYLLSLNNSYEELKNKYSTNCKRNINKAIKNQLVIRSSDAKVIIDLYRNNYNHIATNCTHNDYLKFEALVDLIQKKGNAEILGVYSNDELCSGAIFFKENKRIYYMLGANNGIGKKNGAFHFLINSIVLKYSGSDLMLDFEGSEIKSIEDFYLQFGSIKEDYFYLKINNLPWLLNVFKK